MRKNDLLKPTGRQSTVHYICEMMKIRICFYALLSVFAFQNTIYAQHNLGDKILEDWSLSESLKHTTLAFYAVELKSGQVIGALNEQKAMVPASLMKLPTTIAALELLGPSFTFETELAYTGFIDNGVLHGDLILSGTGDPTLGSSRFGEAANRVVAKYAEALLRMGIREVTGEVIINRSFEPQVPGTWSWEDIANYYAAVPHSINFMENQFTMVFSTGASDEPAKLISVVPDIPDLKIVNEVIAADISGDQTFCYGHPLQNEIVVRGKLPARQSAYKVKGAIPNPEVFFAEKIMSAAAGLGVKWNGKIRVQQEYVPADEEVFIIRQPSPVLSDIIRETNLHSINLFAEAMAVAVGKNGGSAQGIQEIEGFWKARLPESGTGLLVKDASGLSAYNTLTAVQLVEMLKYVHSGSQKMVFENSLPIAGQSGTLRNFGKGTLLEGKLRAKSGYMTGSRGYAGFMNLSSGRKIAFAIMANHYDISAAQMRLEMQAVLEKIGQLH